MDFLKSLFGGSANTLSAADAKARIESSEPLIILDVRQPNEFKSGHIAGATLIPLNELSRRMADLPRDKEILCVCHSGMRSSSASGQLSRAGFRTLNLRGGMMSWQKAGYPVKKGK